MQFIRRGTILHMGGDKRTETKQDNWREEARHHYVWFYFFLRLSNRVTQLPFRLSNGKNVNLDRKEEHTIDQEKKGNRDTIFLNVFLYAGTDGLESFVMVQAFLWAFSGPAQSNQKAAVKSSAAKYVPYSERTGAQEGKADCSGRSGRCDNIGDSSDS